MFLQWKHCNTLFALYVGGELVFAVVCILLATLSVKHQKKDVRISYSLAIKPLTKYILSFNREINV